MNDAETPDNAPGDSAEGAFEGAAPEAAAAAAPGPEASPETSPEASFVTAVAMENDPDEFFPGDRGVLAPEVRRVLVRLLRHRFIFADRHPADWKLLLEHQQVIESRLHDLFVRLVVDPARGVAYKQQVRSEELEIPILLKDDAYTRAETLVLVYLRTVYQRESTAGEPAARVDIEEVEQTVLTYFTEADGDVAKRQRTIRRALERLRQEGIVEEESEGRFSISPLIEIVLSADRLRALNDWLITQQRERTAGMAAQAAGADESPDSDESHSSGQSNDSDHAEPSQEERATELGDDE